MVSVALATLSPGPTPTALEVDGATIWGDRLEQVGSYRISHSNAVAPHAADGGCPEAVLGHGSGVHAHGTGFFGELGEDPCLFLRESLEPGPDHLTTEVLGGEVGVQHVVPCFTGE